VERGPLEAFVFDDRAAALLAALIDRDGIELELMLFREGAETEGALDLEKLLPLLILEDEELNTPEADRVTAGALLAAEGVDLRFDPIEELVNPLPRFIMLP